MTTTQYMQDNTCVNFQYLAANPGTASLRFFDGGACYSNIGNVQQTPQDVSIAVAGCLFFSTVTHEVMHAMGYYHEQSR
jgi:hypothetical protein